MLTDKKRWMGALQFVTVLSNIGFTILYILHSPIAFIFGILGPLLLGVLSWHRQLYADVLLQIFYIIITLYGWLHLGSVWSRSFYPIEIHIFFIALSAFTGYVLGRWLQKNTNAAYPIFDSIITTLSMFATLLMMNGCHENWVYFIFIDAACIFLFFKRRLYGISVLYFLYLLLAIEGYFNLVGLSQ